MKEGAVMNCPLPTDHLCFWKCVLGVKRTTRNWTVLRASERGQEPLQIYWFRAAIRSYNFLEQSKHLTEGQNLMPWGYSADRVLSIIPGVTCWTSEVLTAFEGLQRSELCAQSVRNGSVINVREFAVVVVAHTAVSGLECAEAAHYKAPRYLNLDLGRHVQRNISRFRLRTHKMRVRRACWQTAYGHYVGWRGPVTGRSAEQSG
eukprot:1143041-Pelagomonas_calceolata.AAC.1